MRSLGLAIISQSSATQTIASARDAISTLVDTLPDLERLVSVAALSAGAGAISPVGPSVVPVAVDAAKRFSARRTLRKAAEGIADPATALVELCETVAQRFRRETIVITIDAAENLPDESIRLICDIAECQSENLLVRLAVKTLNTEARSTLERLLEVVAAVEMPVGPLSQRAIEEWLGDKGLPTEVAPDLRQLTSGYPLHIADAIKELELGATLDDIPVHSSVAQKASRLLARLPIEQQRAIRRLAILRMPLSITELLRDFVDFSVREWDELNLSARENRLFVDHVDGQSWFHEQRRRGVLETLEADEIESAAADAAHVLGRYLEVTGDLWWSHEFIALCRAAKTSLREPIVEKILNLPLLELQTLAAVVELAEPNSDWFVEAWSALSYARERGASSTSLDTLRSLAVKEVLELHTVDVDNTSVTMVRPIGGVAAVAAIAGRSASELSNGALPGLASLVVNNVLLPAVGGRALVVAAIGNDSGSGVAERLYRELSKPGTLPRLGGAVVKLTAVGAHLWSGIQYLESSCDANALENLTTDLAGHPVTVDAVLKIPGLPVPTALLRSAVALARTGTPQLIPPSDPQSDPEIFASRRFAASQALHEIASEHERLVLGLRGEMGVAWSDFGSVKIVADFESSSPEVIDLGQLATHQDWLDKFSGDGGFLKASELLPFDARLIHVRTSSGAFRSDAELELAKEVERTGTTWNRHQRKIGLDLDPEILEAFLVAGLDRVTALARYLGFTGGLRVICHVWNPVEGIGDFAPAAEYYIERTEDSQNSVTAKLFKDRRTRPKPPNGDDGWLGNAWLDVLIGKLTGHDSGSVSTFESVKRIWGL